MNKKICLFLIFISILFKSAYPQLRLDYYYDQSGMYTKFSDWIPKKLHKWHPRHVEDFFLLYSLKQHYGEEKLRRNIYFLKIALKKKFRHPRNALIPIKNKREYHKYRLLIFMHLNLKIMRSYLRIGSLFDKRHLYFYNLDFADELKESFSIAEGFYKEAIPYWKKAVQYSKEASRYPFEIDLDTLETIRFDMMTGKINFSRYIRSHLSRLKKKQRTVDAFIQDNR